MSTDLTIARPHPAPAVSNRSLLDMLSSYEMEAIGCDAGYSGKVPGDDDRAVLKARSKELRAHIDHQNNRAAALAVSRMLELFGGARVSPDEAQQIVVGYVAALRGVPLFAIQSACASLSAGEHPDVNPDFRPSSARVAQVARSYAHPHWNELHRIQRVLGYKLAERPDEATRERIAKKLQELLEWLKNATKEMRERESEEYEKRPIVKQMREIAQQARERQPRQPAGEENAWSG